MKVIVSKNSKIEGLITKDLLQLKNYKNILITCIILSIFAPILLSMGDGWTGLFSIFPVIITFAFGIVSMSIFNYDEVSKADKYIKSMPISTKEVVLSKYIFVIAATIIGLLIGVILRTILPKESTFDGMFEIFVLPLVGLLCLSIIESIQIPCVYKFGAEKARMQIFIVIVIIVIMLALLTGGLLYWIEILEIDTRLLEALLPFSLIVLTMLAYFTSYRITYKIYEKKEF